MPYVVVDIRPLTTTDMPVEGPLPAEKPDHLTAKAWALVQEMSEPWPTNGLLYILRDNGLRVGGHCARYVVAKAPDDLAPGMLVRLKGHEQRQMSAAAVSSDGVQTSYPQLNWVERLVVVKRA